MDLSPADPLPTQRTPPHRRRAYRHQAGSAGPQCDRCALYGRTPCGDGRAGALPSLGRCRPDKPRQPDDDARHSCRGRIRARFASRAHAGRHQPSEGRRENIRPTSGADTRAATAGGQAHSGRRPNCRHRARLRHNSADHHALAHQARGDTLTTHNRR